MKATARERTLAQQYLADRHGGDDEAASLARWLAMYREELFDRFELAKDEMASLGDYKSSALLAEVMNAVRHERFRL